MPDSFDELAKALYSVIRESVEHGLKPISEQLDKQREDLQGMIDKYDREKEYQAMMDDYDRDLHSR